MTDDPRLRRRLAALCGAVVGYAVLLGLVYWVAVRTVNGREFGDAALRGGLLTRSAVTDTVDAVLDVVSVAMLLGALAVVATIALLRLARVPGLAALGLMVGANGTTWLLKEHLLTRPDLGLAEYTPATLNSLPSGHTTAAFSAVAAVVFVLPHRLRLPVAVAGGVASVLAAMATLFAGWHRPSDSVAAFLVVGAWTAAAAAAVVAFGTPPTGEPDPPSSRARWFLPTAVGTLVLGLGLALVLDAASGVRDAALGQAVAVLAGLCFVTGTAALVLFASLRLLEVAEAPAQSRTRPVS